MTTLLEAVFRHSDFSEDAPVKGSCEDMISLFRRVDWPSAFGEHAERATYPELIVSLPNGDNLGLQYLGPGGLFQCTTLMTVPKPIFGLDIWIFRETWESEAVELHADGVIDVLKAFARKDTANMKALWSQAKAHA